MSLKLCELYYTKSINGKPQTEFYINLITFYTASLNEEPRPLHQNDKILLPFSMRNHKFDIKIKTIDITSHNEVTNI